MAKGMTYLKKDDQVEVTAGKDKGRVGKVLQVFPDKERALVERINMIKRHTKPTEMNQQGQIVNREATIHVSNLQLICPECTKTGKVGSPSKANSNQAIARSIKWVRLKTIIITNVNRLCRRNLVTAT